LYCKFIEWETLSYKTKRKKETDMADTPTGETVTPEAPSNSTGTTTAPVTDNSSADVEAAKKEAEQARMRANQLENELKKVKDVEAARSEEHTSELQSLAYLV